MEFAECMAIDASIAEQQERQEEQRKDEAAAAAALAEATAAATNARIAARKAGAEVFAARPALEGPTTRLQCRFASGAKVMAEFRTDATLAEVVDWVECCAYLKGSPPDLEVPERFSLSTNFPSRELLTPDADRSVSVEALGLCPSGVLLCRDLED